MNIGGTDEIDEVDEIDEIDEVCCRSPSKPCRNELSETVEVKWPSFDSPKFTSTVL